MFRRHTTGRHRLNRRAHSRGYVGRHRAQHSFSWTARLAHAVIAGHVAGFAAFVTVP